MSICILCPEGHPVIVAAGKLGGVAACPRCFTSFLVEVDAVAVYHARKEERKSRRSRDDDDDEDDQEEEKPKKKRPAKKEDKEEKRPAKASRAKKDEDEDDEEEDEEEEEEEEEIKWNSRKRQLNICKTGAVIYMIAYWILVAFFLVTMLALDLFAYGVLSGIGLTNSIEKLDYSIVWLWCFGFIAGPFLALAELALMVGMFFSMAVPPKAEGKGLLLCGLVFGGLVFLNGVLILLAWQQIIVSDEARAMNMIKLLGGGAALCFLVSIMSAMSYMSKLMIFMRLNMEASQPVTNTMFFFLFYLAMFVLFLATAYVCYYLHYFVGYVMIIAIDAMAGLGIRSLIAQTMVFLKVNKVITTYIKEA